MVVPAIRSLVLAGLSVATAAGVLPGEVAALIRDNAELVVSGVSGAWAVVAGIRAWREREQRGAE